MKKILRLTESDLVRLVKKIIKEGPENSKYYLGDNAKKYLLDKLTPFGFKFQPAMSWAPDMIVRTGLPNGGEIFIMFDEEINSNPEKHYFELIVDTENDKQFVKKYPFTKKDDYAGSNILNQILNDLKKWETLYNPLKKK